MLQKQVEKLCSMALSKLVPIELFEQVKKDAELEGFESIYLCIELNEFYEKYGFKYIGEGSYPDGQAAKIYEAKLVK